MRLARHLASLATMVVALAGAAVAWLHVVEELRSPDHIRARGTPAAIVWSGRVFRSEAELAGWLRSRGIVYERWARAHPAAVTVLRARDRAAADAAGRPSP